MNDDDANDPLLDALAALPRPTADERVAARTGREARRAFLRAAGRDRPPLGALGHVARLGPLPALAPLAVPLLLAGVVGVYLSWAIGAAAALLH